MDIENLKGKKIALIFGQSIEGCGVTRTGAEMYHWCKNNDIDFTIFSYDERMYNRRDAHEFSFVPFMKENIPEMVEKLNDYDVVIFNSYPSNKFPKESIIAFYNDFIKKIKTVKIGFMHELTRTNIDKIPYLLGILNQMDLIYNFGEKTWFSQTIQEILPSKCVGERVKKFTMWFNFDILDKYRNEIKLEDKEKKLLYVGRWTTMKDPRRVLDLGPLLLEKDSNFKSELIGIERSIGAKFDIFEHPNTIDMTGKEAKYGEFGCVPVFGTYVRDEGMALAAKSLFGCNFYKMPNDANGYGDRMEYSQIEIIAVGSIPVFDKHWAENNRTIDGKRYIDIPFSGVYSDANDLDETVNKLIEIANDKELQKKYIETSYKVTKNEFDANIVLPKMFTEMLNIGKDDFKFSSDEDLIKYQIDEDFNEEFIELFKKYTEENEIPVMGIRELYTNNIFCILDGKKEKEIKKFKKSKSRKKDLNE